MKAFLSYGSFIFLLKEAALMTNKSHPNWTVFAINNDKDIVCIFEYYQYMIRMLRKIIFLNKPQFFPEVIKI